jgi:hypothetical protein
MSSRHIQHLQKALSQMNVHLHHVISDITGATGLAVLDAIRRAAVALRLGARSLPHSHSYLGEYYRRMRAKLGAPKAIVAAVHKLARILYRLIATRQECEESVFAALEAKSKQRAQARLEAQARALGFRLAPAAK